MRYYVYALIDPTSNNKPFYIGKGKGNRVKAHFKEASSDEKIYLKNEKMKIEIDISEIAENEMKDFHKELQKESVESSKIKKIKELYKADYELVDMVRIIAKNLDEPTAFAIEAFLIKTVYGFNNLTNRIEGKDTERFRPCDHWEFIEGFDSISSLGMKSEEQLKLMLTEGRELPLLQIEKAFPELNFKEPHYGNRLYIEADIEGTKIRILTCKINIQVELRGGNKEQHLWLRRHLKELGVENLIRRDNVFIPALWKGTKNMTSDVEIAIKRVKLLLEIAMSDNREQLSTEALQLIIK